MTHLEMCHVGEYNAFAVRIFTWQHQKNRIRPLFFPAIIAVRQEVTGGSDELPNAKELADSVDFLICSCA